MRFISDRAAEESAIVHRNLKNQEKLRHVKTQQEADSLIAQLQLDAARRIELQAQMDVFQCAACGDENAADQGGRIYTIAAYVDIGGSPVMYGRSNCQHFYLCAGCDEGFQAYNDKR